jgi:hypothetical protein
MPPTITATPPIITAAVGYVVVKATTATTAKNVIRKYFIVIP